MLISNLYFQNHDTRFSKDIFVIHERIICFKNIAKLFLGIRSEVIRNVICKYSLVYIFCIEFRIAESLGLVLLLLYVYHWLCVSISF